MVVEIGLWAVAAGMLLLAARKPEELRRGGTLALGNFRRAVPLIVLGILAAGYLGEILPRQWVAQSLGESSGVGGVLLAALLGPLVPGGPMICFPLALAILKAGAGTAQVVAFVSSWSLLALHRVLVWEIPLVGGSFAGRRILASLLLPVCAGLLAMLLLRVGAG